MRRAPRSIQALAFAVLGAAGAWVASPNCCGTNRSHVTRVVDGDTLVVNYRDEGNTKVRLLGINTPERNEPGYEHATQALREMVDRKSVLLHFEAPRRRDNFGRLLARVEVDGVDVCRRMLDLGLAEPYAD